MKEQNQLINANVLEINKFIFDTVGTDGIDRRLVTDYELDFHIKGSRTLSINDEFFSINGGDIIFRKPGDYCTNSGQYNTYVLTLDFSHIPGREINYDRNISKPLQPLSDNPVLQQIPSHFIPHHTSDYIRIFDKLLFVKSKNADPLMTDLLINELFCMVLTDVFHARISPFVEKNQLIENSCKYMRDNYEKPITLSQLAAQSNLSESYFLKMFKAGTNSSPISFLLSIRLQNAKIMLSETDYKISYISAKCGFSNTSYFSYMFKRQAGISPAEFRKITQHA